VLDEKTAATLEYVQLVSGGPAGAGVVHLGHILETALISSCLPRHGQALLVVTKSLALLTLERMARTAAISSPGFTPASAVDIVRCWYPLGLLSLYNAPAGCFPGWLS
jgi:hypothetical protein